MPGPKRALRVKTRYFEPGAQKRIREKNAAEFAKTCKEIEERMTKRQHRRRYGDTTPTAPPMGQVIYLFVDTQHRGVASTTGNW